MPTKTIATNERDPKTTYRPSRPTNVRPVPGGGSSGASSALERWLLRHALQAIGNPPIKVQLWDGESVCPQPHLVNFRVHVDSRRTLWKLFLQPDFEFADGYVEGRITTDGELTELLRTVFAAMADRLPRPRLEKFLSWATGHARSLKASRENIHHHYDLGNDFYRLWLDEQLLYTCAYFESEEMSLEAAQVAKMDYICKKLCLQPGDRVIEAGCGWGSFALHMARHYGAQVTAYNISREQLAFARARAAAEGLSDAVTFVEDDWRQIRGECDVFVSVGMLEHVGPEHYRKMGKIIKSCLVPQGRGLIHSIGLNRPRPIDRWTEQRIFPGAQPPALSEAMAIFEPSGMSVLDVENLRLHYAKTLRHWLARFERSSDVVRELFDETFVRMWRLYLASSIATFETGGLQLFQILFAPATNNGMPETRSHLYPLRPGTS